RRAEELATERDRVLRMIDESESQPQLGQVPDRERRSESASKRLRQSDGLLPVVERAPVIALAVGDEPEVREGVRASTLFAEPRPVFEHTHEDRARLVELALRQQSNRTVEPRPQLRRRVAERRR